MFVTNTPTLLDGSFLDQLVDIDRRCSSPSWTREQFKGEFDSTHSSLFGSLDTDGSLAGFIVVHQVQGQSEVVTFGVEPQRRKKGVGAQLLRFALNFLKSRDVSVVTLEVRASNQSAISLYKKEGFVVQGQRSSYYSDTGEDALLMYLDIGGVV